MSDEEVVKFYDELKEYYGDALTDFEHYPITFSHQIKIYRYYKEKGLTFKET
jgi:hypothetical protein